MHIKDGIHVHKNADGSLRIVYNPGREDIDPPLADVMLHPEHIEEMAVHFVEHLAQEKLAALVAKFSSKLAPKEAPKVEEVTQ